MPTHLHFLGWDAPATEKVRDYLLPATSGSALDFSDTLIICPTRQSGRRLREAMAVTCGERGSALLSLQVITPGEVVQPDQQALNIASSLDVSAAWARVLMDLNPEEFPALFPTELAHQDIGWAVMMGQRLQDVRNRLVDAMTRLQDVPAILGSGHPEIERWNNLADLEKRYFSALDGLKRLDPVADKIRQCKKASVPEGIKRIVLAAVSDPTPLLIHFMGRQAAALDIEILVHADADQEAHFDAWGRPETASWLQQHLELPDEDQIILCAGPASQAQQTLQLIARHADEFGPQDLAVGVVDDEVKPYLADDLEKHNLLEFDPAGYSLADHPLFTLLEQLYALLRERNFRTFAQLLRHPTMLNWLEEDSVSALQILRETDDYQSKYLPLRFSHLEHHSAKYPAYEHAHRNIQTAIDDIDKGNHLPEVLQALLQKIFAKRTLRGHDATDQLFAASAKALNNVLASFEASCVTELKLSRSDQFRLLLQELRGQTVFPSQEPARIDLEGWLELPWNDAPCMIVTGMNDERIPDGRLGDIFLPDSVLKELNLRNADDRFARDAYLMQSLIQSRQSKGATYFLFGKVSAAGDPLKPSRLFFQCSDETLISRAGRLFKEPASFSPNVAVEPGFVLQPPPPEANWQERLDLKQISVTAFRDYLACPFRYLLSRVFRMDTVTPNKTELDPMDFGNLVHRVLSLMSEEQDLCRLTDPEKLIPWLHDQVDQSVAYTFGRDLLLPIQIQVDSAKQRLSAYARHHCQSVLDGWTIVEAEKKHQRVCNGVELIGYIDRVDYHPVEKRYRVIDFKTADNPKKPDKAHWGPVRIHHQPYMIFGDEKPKAWTDLQLPLYRYLLEEQLEKNTTIELGYFNLPKAVSDAQFEMLALPEAAFQHGVHCAEQIIDAINDRIFGPVAEVVPYENFAPLFFNQPDEYIDIPAFLKAVQK